MKWSNTGEKKWANFFLPIHLHYNIDQASVILSTWTWSPNRINSYSASHDNWCTATLWNRIMTAQCEGMGEVGCPSIRVLCYSNFRDPPNHTSSLRVKIEGRSICVLYIGHVIDCFIDWLVQIRPLNMIGFHCLLWKGFIALYCLALYRFFGNKINPPSLNGYLVHRFKAGSTVAHDISAQLLTGGWWTGSIWYSCRVAANSGVSTLGFKVWRTRAATNV